MLLFDIKHTLRLATKFVVLLHTCSGSLLLLGTLVRRGAGVETIPLVLASSAVKTRGSPGGGV